MEHHGAGLLRIVRDEAWVADFKRHWREVEHDAADAAMLAYVEKLTRSPGAMERSDVEALREVGFADKAILEINQIAGFFAMVNRTVDGLGVELEPYWNDGG